ncbi:MAG TPA: branched-chain amino acid ABC transporter permease [Chloroflexota bacterium]|nr:branched-chain amino acid ABC transporter permease [Chloroflexota bacterium]
MSPDLVAQNLLFGLFVGGTYGVAAVGLSLVFGVLRVLNVAHGELLMLGGYVTFWLFTAVSLDPFLSLLVSALLLFLLGLALNQGLFGFVERLDEPSKIKNSLLISFGLTLLIQNAAQALWSADERSVSSRLVGGGTTLAGVVIPHTRLAALVVGLLVVLALDQLLQRTYFGKAVRATAEDWEAASLAGIDVQRTYLVTFALGAALAGVAGTLVSLQYSIAPAVGLAWTLKALVVVVLAGLGSVFGAFAAGLILGVAEAFSVFVIGPAYREVIGLVLFLLVLLLRPQGLFGKAR